MNHPAAYLPDPYLKTLADSDCPLDISLTNDFAFKKTFRNKKALTGLLSCLLDIPAGQITDMGFPDTFLHGDYVEDHEGILDIRLVLNHRKHINIEIQMHTYPFWEERSLFYLAKMYTEDLCKGEDYSSLKECIHISILGFDLKQEGRLFSVIRLMDDRNCRVYSSKLSLRVLYLKQIENATEEEKQTDVYKWARLISVRGWEELKRMAGSDEYMNAAVEEMERINADKELRYWYLMREKAASDETTIRNYYIQKGEQRVNRLIQILLENCRSDDIGRMIHDKGLQEKLFDEFGL